MPHLAVVAWLWMGLAASPAGCAPGAGAPRPADAPGSESGSPNASASPPSDGPRERSDSIAGGDPAAAGPRAAPAAVSDPRSRPILAANLPATRTATAALLAAARHLARGLPDDALAALGSLDHPSLEAHRALLVAESHLARGDRRAALDALARTTGAPTLLVEAERLRARALAPTDPAGAAAVLLALPHDPVDLATAAGHLARAGRAADARGAEDTLLLRFPESPEAQALTSTLTAARAVARFGARSVERVERLLDAHANERARDEARAILADPTLARAFACRARFVEGKSLRKLRHYKGAIEALGHAIDACASDPPRARSAQLLDIQVRAIRGEAKSVRARTEALLAADPSHRFGDDALLLLAQLEERSADTRDAALLTYRRILDAFPTGDQTGPAAWGLAFEAIRREAWADAVPHLEAAIAAPWVEAVDRARARYWLARAHAATKRGETCARFHEAALADGLGFYTWQTLSHLDRSDRPCADALREVLLDANAGPIAAAPADPRLLALPAHTRAIALAALLDARDRDAPAERLRGWARDELRAIDAEVDRVAFGLAFHAVGAHKDAQDVLRAPQTGLLSRPPTLATLEAWGAAYSRPFTAEIEAAAQAEELDPLLLTALSREESTFDPSIVSWAGAVGLAQLMPGTAITAHLAITKRKIDLARLTEPALNLRLGAWVLDDGLRKFDGLVPLALGAYNGGPGLVSKALPAEKTAYDRWSETIPVRETRRYIQRVVGTWGIYRFLYAAPDRRFIELPETISPR